MLTHPPAQVLSPEGAYAKEEKKSGWNLGDAPINDPKFDVFIGTLYTTPMWFFGLSHCLWEQQSQLPATEYQSCYKAHRPHLGPPNTPSVSLTLDWLSGRKNQQQVLDVNLPFYLVSQTNKSKVIIKKERNINGIQLASGSCLTKLWMY